MKRKVTKVFSGTLMKQDLRSNMALMIICTLIMCMMSIVITYASNMMGAFDEEQNYEEAESTFYSYLYMLASYNEWAGTDLSYDDFEAGNNKEIYEGMFEMLDQNAGMDFSTEGFQEAADTLSESDISLDNYITQFEYVYALGDLKGCFSGDTLDLNDMMNNMLEMMGVSPDVVQGMSEMDPTAMINEMYYTIMLIIPVLLFIVFAGNSLVVDQVDKGSMAYILSTPTKRSAVSITQMLYMIFVPLVMIGVVFGARVAAFEVIVGDVDVQQLLALYGGLYLLVEAMSSICYLASCLFNLSKYALALGGGLNVWFFLASLLGMFGSEDIVSMGMGAEALDNFNKVTIISLVDVDALSTVGSGDVDTTFIWKLGVLAGIAFVCYLIGAVRFEKKDLPL